MPEHLRGLPQLSDADAALLERADQTGRLSKRDQERIDRRVSVAVAAVRTKRDGLTAISQTTQLHMVGSTRSSHSGRGGVDPVLRERVQRLRVSGWSIGKIAREVNLRRETVSKIIREKKKLPTCPGCGGRLLTPTCLVCETIAARKSPAA